MTDLIPFDLDGGRCRFGKDDDGTPWVVASDFAKIMGYSKTQNATDALDDNEKGHATIVTPGGQQRVVVIYEDGIWELIFRSTLPGAKAIKSRVKAILREIRETGSFGKVLKLPSRRDLARMVIEAEDRAESAEQQVRQLEPAAKFAEDLTSREGSWSVTHAAKLLSSDPAIDTGPRLLFQTLLDWGWIYRREGRWTAKQEQINNGRLVHKVYDPRYDDELGRMIDREPQVRITWKGMREVHHRLGGERPLRLDLGEEAS